MNRKIIIVIQHTGQSVLNWPIDGINENDVVKALEDKHREAIIIAKGRFDEATDKKKFLLSLLDLKPYESIDRVKEEIDEIFKMS